MALSAFVGSFTVPSSMGNLPVTGVGFQPKAILFFSVRRSTDGASTSGSDNDDMSHFVGVATSSSSRGVVDVNDDFSAGGITAAATGTLCIRNRNSAGTVQFAADFVSFGADGFTVNFTTANATAFVINFLALGGTDLTDVFVKSFSTATATGNQVTTGVGFQPTAMILIGSETALTVSGVQLGFVTGTTARGALGSAFDSGATAYQRSDRAYAQPIGTGTTVARQADFVSFDSDGFTLNWDTVQAGAMTVYALCLKGGLFKSGNFLQKTSPGTQGTTGVGFQPKAVLMASTLKTASASVVTGRQALHVGAASGASAQAAINYLNGGAGVAELIRTNVYTARQDNGTPTLNSVADLDSFDADGFTLDFTAADAVAREILYFAMGDQPGGSAVLSGTAIGGITEADVVSGGKQIVITVTGDTFIPA